MNIFVIPSWYPSQREPLAGIFIQKQLDALSEIRPDLRIIVSRWGHEDSELAFRSPKKAMNTIWWRVHNASRWLSRESGVQEILTPLLNWSSKLPYGGANRLISINKKNLILAMQRFGKVDLIHAHVSFPGGYIASILSREFKIPYVITEHMGPFPFPAYTEVDGLPRSEILIAFENASKIIAVSSSLSEEIRDLGFPQPEIIPNLVDERQFKVAKIEKEKFIFLTLCTINDQKGIDVLLKAIAKWNPDPQSVEFWIGGDGPMRLEYMRLSKELMVSDRVLWLGKIDHKNVSNLFESCNVCVVPSFHESFSVVCVEAIASGKPVIATKCGGPENIINEENGRLVAVGDMHELVEKLEFMYKHSTIFDPIKIRKDYQLRFSRVVVVNRIVDVYNNIIDDIK